MFAQLLASHAHSNTGIYYTVLLKQCCHKRTKERKKKKNLCNSLIPDSSYYSSPQCTNMRGTMKEKVGEVLLWVYCFCHGLYVLVHLLPFLKCGFGCHIRSLGRNVRTASYNKVQHFWSDKPEPCQSYFYASMHTTQQGIFTKHSCLSLNLDLQAWQRHKQNRDCSFRSKNCIVNN